MTLTHEEQAIVSSIQSRHEALLAELHDHVAIPTGRNYAPGLDKYREMLRIRLEALGADIELRTGDDRPDWMEQPGSGKSSGTVAPSPILIARHDSGGDSPRVLIAGHLDTVHDPDGPFQELEIQPDGTTAVGPGAVDMKGGTLLAIAALEALHEHGVQLNWTYVLNSDEETGSFQSAAVLRDVARECDLGIATEPALADGSLAIERMGSGQFKVEVFGQSAHVGREFTRGVSAVTKLGQLLVQIAAMADPGNGKIVNVGPLQGGVVTNAVPDYAACWGNVRFSGTEAGDDLGRQFDALATDDDSMPRVAVHREWNRPAKPLTPQVQAFAETARAAAEDLSQKLPFASTGGVCDGNILQSVGLPTIDTLGIRGGNLHRTDEFIEIAALPERCQLMAVLLSRIAAKKIDPAVFNSAARS